MSSEPLKFELTPESVRSIIDANVKAAVLGAMEKQGPQLINNLVSNVLSSKINRNYRDISFIDAVVQDFLTEQVKSGLKEYLEANKGLIAKQIEMAIKNSKTGFAKMIAEALAKSSENAYRFEVNLTSRG